MRPPMRKSASLGVSGVNRAATKSESTVRERIPIESKTDSVVYP